MIKIFKFSAAFYLTQISLISHNIHCYRSYVPSGWQARAKRRAFCEICELCVKFNPLCEAILVRLPCAFSLSASEITNPSVEHRRSGALTDVEAERELLARAVPRGGGVIGPGM